MSATEYFEADSLLNRHKSLIAQYAKKFQIDIKREEIPLESSNESHQSQRLSQISESFHKYLGIDFEKCDPRKSLEDDLVIHGDFGETPVLKAETKQDTETKKSNEEVKISSVFEIDESINVDKYLKEYKEKKLRESQTSSMNISIPKVSLGDSIEDLIKRYGLTKKVEKEKKNVGKSEEDIDQILARLKLQLSPKKKPESRQVEDKSNNRSPEKKPKSKKSKMPPKMQQSMSMDDIQKKLRESVKRKSIEDLCTLKSPREKQPLPKDNLLLDKYVEVMPIEVPPPEVDDSKVHKLKDSTSPPKTETEVVKTSPSSISHNEPTNQCVGPIFDQLFKDVTTMLFNESQKKHEYKKVPMNITPAMIKPANPSRIPKYANFEAIGPSSKPAAEKCKKIIRKKTEIIPQEDEIQIKVKLKSPFENKALYEYLPLLEIHTYDNDSIVKQIKRSITDILSQLE